MVDFGYDISDFVDIDPIFGTLEDFKTLVDSAHEFDIKIVMDFGLPQNYNGFWSSNWRPLKGGEFCETWLGNTST